MFTNFKINKTQLLQYLLLALITAFIFYKPIDLTTSDLGRHIKNGEYFIQFDQIIATNFYSYTNPDFPVINHHWFSGVLFYLIYAFFSFKGLSLFLIGFNVLTILILFSIAKKNSNSSIAAFLIVMSIGIIGLRAELRPELFSNLFILVFYYLLNNYKAGKGKTWHLLLLPIIQLLWINLHIFFIFGFFLLGVYILDSIFISKDIAKLKILLFISLICTISSFVNPFGVWAIVEPFIIFHQYSLPVSENLPLLKLLHLNPTFVIHIFVTGFIFIVSAVYLIYKKSKDVKNIFPLILITSVFFIGTIVLNRLFLFFIFFSIIYFTTVLSMFFERLINSKSESKLYKKAELSINVSTAVLSLLIILAVLGNKSSIGIAPDSFKASNFYITNNLVGPIFNNYDIGGYLIFNLYPHTPVYIDNRPEAFSSDFLINSYSILSTDASAWNKINAKYNFNTIIIGSKTLDSSKHAFLKERLVSGDWVLVYAENYNLPSPSNFIFILVRNLPINEMLIRNKGLLIDESLKILDSSLVSKH